MRFTDQSFQAHVVLVHGLWLNGLEWMPLRRRMTRRGYDCHVFRYPSVRQTPAQNARRLLSFVERLGAGRVHLVGHSLGGIVIMHAAGLASRLPPGRAVFIATPALGSHAARRLVRLGAPGRLLGASRHGGLLGDVPQWDPARELGIIAGDLPLGAGRMLGGLARPNDGAVAVAETEVAGASDRICLHGTHLGLLWLRETADRVDRFLRHGRFGRAPDAVQK